MIDKEYGPLQDAQQAILVVRSRAKEWGIKEHRIGIMGFSAGGHLASTAGTHFTKNYIENPEHISLRPDFMILIYPVISFDSAIAHRGSEHNLLGPNPSRKQLKEFSNEKQVTTQTPPAFLVHARDDDAVPYANSLVFADALKKHGIATEVYLFDKGGHGFGMNNKTSHTDWMKICIRWIKGIYPTH
jgi:acetyl esterase/lipase